MLTRRFASRLLSGSSKQKQVGLDDKRAGDGNALSLPAGQFARVTPLESAQADDFQHTDDPLFEFLLLDFALPEPKGHIFKNG